MRSPREIVFRLRQEAANLWLLARPPRAGSNTAAPLAGLPAPDCIAEMLRGSAYAAEIERLAAEILQHRFPLLGLKIETGPEISWRRDYLSGRSTGTDYFRLVPYLDFERAGDHKTIWELNRHQHLVLLGQAWRLTGREEFPREIAAQLESWRAANPYGRGINWASALEVAFRALSWIWIYHLAGETMSAEERRSFLESLYAHGRHLERNLSVYFSPNTHLLGEAVALHALGTLFPDFPGAACWKREGGAIVRTQMDAQVHADGSHFEQSTYYHVYALDMFLFTAALEEMPPAYLAKLGRMADYLDALLGPIRSLPLIGDDDGGRFFHPYGSRDGFGRASLALCGRDEGPEANAEIAAWWPKAGRVAAANPAPEVSRLFEDAGIAVMRAGPVHIVADAGPFGPGGAGHSHSDTLSFVVRDGREELLVDAGTFTYVADPQLRNWFRGSAAHNTIRIDGQDQGDPAGPFRWAVKPEAAIACWQTNAERDYLDASCRYRGFRHRRRWLFVKPDLIFVLDEVEGPPGDHLLEQYWHTGLSVNRISSRCFQMGGARLLLSHDAAAPEGGEHGWRSRALGSKAPAPVLRAAVQGGLPVCLGAVLDLRSGSSGTLEMMRDGESVRLEVAGERPAAARFTTAGAISE